MTQQNIDTACFYLFTNYGDLDGAIRLEVDKLRQDITHALISKTDLQNAIDSSVSKIFTLRIMAIKTLSQENRNYQELVNEAYAYFEKLASDQKLNLLAENIMFSIRSNMRFSKAFFENSISEEQLLQQLNSLSVNLTYEDFLAALSISSPSPEYTATLTDWTKSSLIIEYVIVACSLINDDRIDVPTKIIDELAAIIASAAHTYNAIAQETGFLYTHSFEGTNNIHGGNVSVETILQEKKLTDSDLKGFAQIWRNDD